MFIPIVIVTTLVILVILVGFAYASQRQLSNLNYNNPLVENDNLKAFVYKSNYATNANAFGLIARIKVSGGNIELVVSSPHLDGPKFVKIAKASNTFIYLFGVMYSIKSINDSIYGDSRVYTLTPIDDISHQHANKITAQLVDDFITVHVLAITQD